MSSHHPPQIFYSNPKHSFMPLIPSFVLNPIQIIPLIYFRPGMANCGTCVRGSARKIKIPIYYILT